MKKPRFRVGNRFNLSKDAVDNYCVSPGPYTVHAVYTHYCKPADMAHDLSGHPGFDSAGGSCLYGSELPLDVYEWEMEPII